MRAGYADTQKVKGKSYRKVFKALRDERFGNRAAARAEVDGIHGLRRLGGSLTLEGGAARGWH